MANINFSWQGMAGVIVFPAGTGLDDAAGFTLTGSLTVAQLVAELDEVKHWNRGNLALPGTFGGEVTPREMLTALGILGWFVDPDVELAALLASDDDRPAPPDDDDTAY